VLTIASFSNDFYCIVSVIANIDENNLAMQRSVILRGIATILIELTNFTSSSESEEDEDELKHVMHVVKRKKKLPRLENYVENIVPAYSDHQFKSHFR